MHKLAACLRAAIAAALVATPLASRAVDAAPPRASGLVTKKESQLSALSSTGSRELTPGKSELSPPDASPPPPALLATLVQTHTGERVMLDDACPDATRFAALLGDHVTAESTAVDARLLALLRDLARMHPGARVEIVSGYRSPKRNEMMRKKGRHVASHSQHSLGHAVDFRVVLPGERRGIPPRALEAEIRALGWDGGVGVYTSESDWFVHADVGKLRRWSG